MQQLVQLPPSIFGTIRWKSYVGMPTGDLCSGFSILVEEHTATQFRDIGGAPEPIPGTGMWKVLANPLACHALPTQGDDHAVSFHITGLHLNALPDGRYRITPSLRGDWRPSGLLAALGYRAIEPISASVILKEGNLIQSVEFEVVRRSLFSGRRLGPVVALSSEPTSIFLHARWDVGALLSPTLNHPYNYKTEAGKLRDAVQKFLVDGVRRMTGTAPDPQSTPDLESTPKNSLLLVLYPDAPAILRADPAVQATLGRTNDGAPDYVADREAFYLKTIDERTFVVANTVDGLVAAMPELLGSVGYEVLGLGTNWTFAPSFHDRPLRFHLDEGHRNNGYYMRRLSFVGLGGNGYGTLVEGFDLNAPDEHVTSSCARWRVGTRLCASHSVPLFTGDELDSYADAVFKKMLLRQGTDGFLTAQTVYGPLAERPAPEDLPRSLWIDGEAAWYSKVGQNDTQWRECNVDTMHAPMDLSTAWVRETILEILIGQADAEMWKQPDEWFVFGAQPEDNAQYAHFAEEVHYPDWYTAYRAEQDQPFSHYVLHDFLGIEQPNETFNRAAPSDTVFAFGNWLLREYDNYVDTLDEGPQQDPDTPTKLTRSGVDRKTLIRIGLSSYNYNDVPPHFNLDPRVRVIVAHFAKHRGIGEWSRFISRENIARAMQRMLPNEPIANYAAMDDFDWDKATMMSQVLPHLWGNSPESILAFIQPFTLAGVRSWQAETDMGYTNHALGFYLMSKYLWDPSLGRAGLSALRDQWLVRAFGPAAGKMRAYFEWCEPNLMPDVPNVWGRAIELLDEADALVPAGSEYQRRLDDLKQFWYFYYLMDTGQLVASNERAQELMWKGQSAFTIPTYQMSYRVFKTPWLALIPEIAHLTTTPAHYSEAKNETEAWWTLVKAHWPHEAIASWRGDTNDLVAVAEFDFDLPGSSRALNNTFWDYPGTQGYLVAKAGDDVGFKLLWHARDLPHLQEYHGPHYTEFTIKRWDGAAGEWVLVEQGGVDSVRLAAEAVFFATEEAWLVEAHHTAAIAGTYRVTHGYGGADGFLADAGWDVAQPPTQPPTGGGFTFAQRVVADYQFADSQGEHGAIFVYVPRGIASFDLEMVDPGADYEKTVTFFDAATGEATRTVDITAPGTHRIALMGHETGTVARVFLGTSALTVPYFYSVPPLWSRSPRALLVPRAVAAVDGLTIL